MGHWVATCLFLAVASVQAAALVAPRRRWAEPPAGAPDNLEGSEASVNVNPSSSRERYSREHSGHSHRRLHQHGKLRGHHRGTSRFSARRGGRRGRRGRHARKSAGSNRRGSLPTPVADAVAALPLNVGQMFSEFKGGAGNAAELMDALNAVFSRSRWRHDELQSECEGVVGEGSDGPPELRVAREEMRSAQVAVTQLQDRTTSLQLGNSRAAAELEALQTDFTRQQAACEHGRQAEQRTISRLRADKPLASALVAGINGTCNFESGSAPPMVECSLPDASYMVTFKDEALRGQVSNMSGVVEQLLALQLKRCVRVKMAAAFVQVGLGRRKSLVQRRSGSARAKRTRKGLLTVRQLPDEACTDAAAPDCECLADNFATFLGGIDDLVAEVLASSGVESKRCEATLGRYVARIEELDRQAESSSLELASLVPEATQLAGARDARQEDLRDAEREAQHTAERCGASINDASSAMCATRRLADELRDGQTDKPFAGDCDVTEWLAGSCSSPCGTPGGGQQNLTRRVIAARGGSESLCPALWRTRKCNTGPCPVDAKLTVWGDWSGCSQACGGGARTRRRAVSRPPKFGGRPAGETMQVELCNKHPCAMDCVLSDWSAWSGCSRNCSSGHKFRQRHVLQEARGGKCAPEGNPSRLQSAVCNAEACAANAKCASTLDAVFALDSSGSVGDEAFTNYKALVTSVVDRSAWGEGEGQSRYGVLQFGSTTSWVHALSADAAAVKAALVAKASYQASDTNLAEAVAYAGAELEARGRPSARRTVVVVTDGVPRSAYLLAAETGRIRQQGIRVLFVAVGPAGSRRTASHWVSWPPEENILVVPSDTELGDAERQTEVLAALCQHLS